ncbi:mechanosensitive ion channel family protein [Fusibacter ferrireducens]|uniref:Mechanosensitive ion channel n=1 Tax=Fusibacter ferrireducens TaxID=2785058 RepID=A0ABR9ZQ08_9FIRM|nr:mechanosensitive ion channel domain-containing protein [Fusibacter ferrireducens]MBF4692555.1 mechanosensitive ion channel [Fusibacter ferrireducens]
MIEFVEKQLIAYGLNEKFTDVATNAVVAMMIALISICLYFIAKKVVLKIIENFIKKSKTKWDDILLKHKVFERLIHMIPAIVVHSFAPMFPSYQVIIQKIAFCYILVFFLLALDEFFNVIDDIYSHFEASKSRPIKGYLQVFKIISYIVGIIVVIGVVMDRSPLILLGSIGAASAVLLLIFQNSILGLVAGVQLSANDMIRLGDWIEMSKYGADGEVIEISLHTVKVQNWDKSITTIPSYALISESFINWKGMQESGSRRIKRAIYIDMTSIKFCDELMLDRYKKIEYLKPYLERKEKEILHYNESNSVDRSNIVNGRHLTNIGTLRVYIETYLKNHPKISKDMILMVRQLAPNEKGLPLEIYGFINDNAWVNYEAIQSDIFDHIFAIILEFDLRIFQNPTGNDLRSMVKCCQL